MAHIRYRCRTYYVGSFDDEIEAAKARERKAHASICERNYEEPNPIPTKGSPTAVPFMAVPLISSPTGAVAPSRPGYRLYPE